MWFLFSLVDLVSSLLPDYMNPVTDRVKDIFH